MESFEERLERQREERKQESARREIRRKAEIGQVPVNREQADQVRRTFTEMRGHTAPARSSSSKKSDDAQSIKFACYNDDGEFGEIELSALSGFTPKDP